MTKDEKLQAGQTVFLKHPIEDLVAMLNPKLTTTIVKWRGEQEYGILNTTNLAMDVMLYGEEITEGEYQKY